MNAPLFMAPRSGGRWSNAVRIGVPWGLAGLAGLLLPLLLAAACSGGDQGVASETPPPVPPMPPGAPVGAQHLVPSPKFVASGGPFASQSAIEQVALQAARSYLADPNDQNIVLGPVIPSRYGEYTSILGLGRSTEFASDREMYIVGVYGAFKLKRLPPPQVSPALGYLNLEIDATTGDVVGMFTSTQTQDPAVQLALAASSW